MPNGIWRIKDGKSTMVLDAWRSGGIPNGIALSPTSSISTPTPGQRMMRYEVKADGSLGPGSLFTQGPGIGDGMKVDPRVTSTPRAARAQASSAITSPAGTLLGYLNLPIVGGEPKRQICATNVAFGDRIRQEPLRHCLRPRLIASGIKGGGGDAGTADTLR